MTAPDKRAERRRVQQVAEVCREHVQLAKGNKRINKQLIVELSNPPDELLAFIDTRFEHWSAGELAADQIVLLVEDELYRCALAADHEELPLPVVLARRHA